MTYAEATIAARAAYEAANPESFTPATDFTVPPEVYDAIEARIDATRGVIAKLFDDPADGRPDHLMWYGLRMYRGDAPA